MIPDTKKARWSGHKAGRPNSRQFCIFYRHHCCQAPKGVVGKILNKILHYFKKYVFTAQNDKINIKMAYLGNKFRWLCYNSCSKSAKLHAETHVFIKYIFRPVFCHFCQKMAAVRPPNFPPNLSFFGQFWVILQNFRPAGNSDWQFITGSHPTKKRFVNLCFKIFNCTEVNEFNNSN
jgi:hypothetical protein